MYGLCSLLVFSQGAHTSILDIASMSFRKVALMQTDDALYVARYASLTFKIPVGELTLGFKFNAKNKAISVES